MNQCFFDPRYVEREPLIEVLEEGTYVVSVNKVTRIVDNFGDRIKVLYKVVSPDTHKDKFLSDNYNVGHAKEVVANIGKAQFARVLDCIGMGNEIVEDAKKMEGKQLKVVIDIVPHFRDVGQTQNKIRKYMPVNTNDLLSTDKENINKNDDLPF